jgi:hypothetical protein
VVKNKGTINEAVIPRINDFLIKNPFPAVAEAPPSSERIK